MITSTIVRKPRQRPTTVPLQNDDEVSHGNIVCVPLYQYIVGGCGEESLNIYYVPGQRGGFLEKF